MLRNKRVLQACWKAGSGLIIAAALFAVVSISAASVNAQSLVCLKNVGDALTLNGVVAQGAGGPCPVGPVWPNVAPVEFLPGGGSPNAYLFVAYKPDTKHLLIGLDLKGDPDLSSQDIVMFVFDANNSNSFDVGDFVIKVNIWNQGPIETGNTGALQGADCNQATGAVEVLRFGNSGWEPTNANVGAEVKTKLSYDYEVSTDPEDEIWNLEIAVPVGKVVDNTTQFNLNTSGSFFRIGAYIFMDIGHHDGSMNPQTGTVLKWPSEMVDRQITQQNLFGIPSTAPGELAVTDLADNCFDVNLNVPTPWEINGSAAKSQDHRIKRTGDNEFRVTFNFKGPGIAVGSLSNPGTVRLELKPYTSGGTGPVISKDVNIDPAQFNKATTVTFHHDFAGAININFICATIKLIGFPRNDNKSNDSLNINYNYFTTSDYATEFMVNGDAIPHLKPGETGTVFMRMESFNDPEAGKPIAGGVVSHPVRRAFGSNPAIVLTLIIFVGSGLILLLSRRWRHKPQVKVFASALALMMLVTLSLQIACKRKQPPATAAIGTPRWGITNAEALGIKPVEGQRGWYQMPISFGEAKMVQLTFQGKPLSYNTVTQTLTPAAPDGNPNILRVRVRPGGAVTILASGEIDLDGRDGPRTPTSASGQVAPVPTGRRTYLLREGYYSPHEYAGAVIGSFDNFATSFVVGRSNSILVPTSSEQLSLAVNAELGSYGNIVGTYEISTIDTPGPARPTHTWLLGDATAQVPPSFPLWQVLTSLNVYTYYETFDRSNDGRIIGRTLNQAGGSHFSIYASHAEREPR